MNLVEDDERSALDRRIVLQPPGEHALGDHLNPGCRRHAPLVPCGEADGHADVLAEQVRHPPCSRSGGEATWFQHEDPAEQPLGLQEGKRHDGGLAGARGSGEDRCTGVAQGCLEVGQDAINGEAGSDHVVVLSGCL